MSEYIILYETNRAGLLLTNSECKRIPLISITMGVRYASPARRVKKESSLFIFILLRAPATITCHGFRYYYKRSVWECSRPSWGRCLSFFMNAVGVVGALHYAMTTSATRKTEVRVKIADFYPNAERCYSFMHCKVHPSRNNNNFSKYTHYHVKKFRPNVFFALYFQ